MESKQFPNFSIRSYGMISAAFCERGITDFHRAVEHVRDLPYGRTSNKTNLPLVLVEERGTCSTKHALLAQLATEHGVDTFQLTLGIYEMSERNTSGVGRVLSDYGLESIPEAHCYLSTQSQRFDFTKPNASVPVGELLYEETIQPPQIGAYKVRLHRRYLAEWGEQERPECSTDELWEIREDCIAALEQ
ncbi:hypothetical protein [Halomarina pelagica]|uniref:hypothetical protein n=1 Tax=Halomarina pelagica TaxID=2961599 RepID=UPI0020C54736|nr:hypothetical protein [Halomarina sp. BND7]